MNTLADREALVVQLIPYDTIGGVETAARSVPAEWRIGGRRVQFTRAYLVTRDPQALLVSDWHGAAVSENSLRAQWRLLRFVWGGHPDLVIGSLWRCLPVLLAVQLFARHCRTVLFLHSSVDVHVIDWLLNRLAMIRADEIWADSSSSLNARVPMRWKHKGRVLSFLTGGISVQAPTHPEPNFIFWGRLQREKNLARALDLFVALRRAHPDARFSIVGPDRGERAALERQVEALGLAGVVQFFGPLPRTEIFALARSYSFYLQTSDLEGMAMSVVEAMALGLVPVVTPVGEISAYCRDGENAIFVIDTDTTVRRVGALLALPDRYAAMASLAATTWAGSSHYRDDFVAACNRLLSRSG